jgi:phage tail sheath protein FI
MSQLTFKSPGVSTREIDLSQPTRQQPSGTPAGVIGTARRGPAFVPVTVATFRDYVTKFGNTDGESFGPLAMSEWLRNASAGTYVRLLGIGDGKIRQEAGTNAGRVNNAGFVVGNPLVSEETDQIANNPNVLNGIDLSKGRTYFLGCLMKDSPGSTLFKDAGIDTATVSTPVIRAVLLAAQGVEIKLEADNEGTLINASLGDVSATGTFKVILENHKPSESFASVIESSFDPKAPNSISKVFNTDPANYQQAGHLLYAYYDISPELAEISNQGVVTNPSSAGIRAAFALTSRIEHNVGTAGADDRVGIPNFEGFEDRYRTAFSPWVTSQTLGDGSRNLFKFHALDDGQAGSDTFKITLENIQASTNENNLYGTFDVLVRRFDDSDRDPIVLESFRGLSLDPRSDRFILRAIGDMHMYYDLDKQLAGQKLVVDGTYPNVSNFIRVEGSEELQDGVLNPEAMPMGFRGLHHLVTAGSSANPIEGDDALASILTGDVPDGATVNVNLIFQNVKQPPVPMRSNLATGTGNGRNVLSRLTWGVQFDQLDSIVEPNKNTVLEESLRSFVRYMPYYHTTAQNPWVGDNEGTPDLGGSVLDADRFNNNAFSLNRIAVIVDSNNKPDPDQWASATYVRDGVLPASLVDRDGNEKTAATNEIRFLTSDDLKHLPSRRYLKFTLPLQGGFDGVNVFDEQKAKFTNLAVYREFEDEVGQGGPEGPTISAYRKALRVMEEKSDVDIKLLAIPGIRHQSVNDFAIDSVERRFDAMYIMDVEQFDKFANLVKQDEQNVNVNFTAQAHASKNYDTSFAAAYFPDVIMTDPAVGTEVKCPPSVAVLGAMAFNDRVAHPWFAPAGFNRGALATVTETSVKLNRSNMDDLYEVDINPITAFPDTGVVVFGQKTLLASQSALDRVNVRRLLIEIRRRVRAVANTLLFEPNREETLARFRNAVTPILSLVQAQQGVERFSVQIDATTTTQADVENNTIRGKIFVQPTKSVEFVSLDFVVTNAGANI